MAAVCNSVRLIAMLNAERSSGAIRKQFEMPFHQAEQSLVTPWRDFRMMARHTDRPLF